MAEAKGASGDGGMTERIVDRVRERANAQIASQKDRATDGLGSVAQAVRESTRQLREQQHDSVAGYVEQAADQIERLASRLREKSVNELMDDAQDLARRQPALFIGSAFTIGLLGARFLKSSASDRGRIARRHFGDTPDPGIYTTAPGAGYERAYERGTERF